MEIPEDFNSADLLPMAQHRMENLAELISSMRPAPTRRPLGPRRLQRRAEYNARVHDLKVRLEITGGTGNFMVNLCRSGTAQAERDKAARAFQRPAAGPHPSVERLTTFGLDVSPELHPIRGGTARQRACYVRAYNRDVIRHMTEVAA